MWVQAVSSKQWKSLAPALTSMLSSPGFAHVNQVVSDKEAALSRRNVSGLVKALNRPELVFVRSAVHKAWIAERGIRTFKTRLAVLCKKAGLHIAKGWQKFIPQALAYCNTKIVLSNGMTPRQVNLKNFAQVEQQLNPAFHAALVGSHAFKYKVGASLMIKDRALTFPETKFTPKRSLFGYNSGTRGTVIRREVKSTGPLSKYLTPFYELDNGLGWFREKDLAAAL